MMLVSFPHLEEPVARAPGTLPVSFLEMSVNVVVLIPDDHPPGRAVHHFGIFDDRLAELVWD